MSENTCNVSVLAWPSGATREDAAAILMQALGMDPFMARLRAAKPPPMVVARAVEPVARSIMDALKTHRTPAFMVRDEDIRRLPTPLLAKRLEAAVGAPRPMYMVEPWRGEGAGIVMDDVYCIVRGRIGRASVGPVQIETTPSAGYGRFGDMYVEEFDQFEVSATRKRSSRLSDMIDLWMLDRSNAQERAGRIVHGIKRVRINCDKFAWDVLGDEKGMSDNENADRLALRLAGEAKDATIELGFAAFREASAPAIGTGWSSTPVGGSRLDQSPAFEFYSAWCALLNWTKSLSRQ